MLTQHSARKSKLILHLRELINKLKKYDLKFPYTIFFLETVSTGFFLVVRHVVQVWQLRAPFFKNSAHFFITI